MPKEKNDIRNGILDVKQGDPIGRIFTVYFIVDFGQFMKIRNLLTFRLYFFSNKNFYISGDFIRSKKQCGHSGGK
jgi:hypothetical protein